ncbi:MAG: site-specific DNA-methyltransferase [Deltaproteobacteria bacterium]|jgi:DNA modification methylase|nr:site-specific DNA-methyltransferase [Deltaproteobacteria bacterium]
MLYLNDYYKNTPLDTKTIDQDLLNITDRSKTNPLPWNGQFSPQLIEILLHHFSNQSDILFDPFLGSGTTLLEAGEQNREAYGTDINHAAVSLAKIYELINFDNSERLSLINEFDGLLKKYGIIYSNLIIKEKVIIKNQLDILYNKYLNSKYKILLNCFIILLDLYKNDFSIKRLTLIWQKIKNLISNLPLSDKKICVFQEDARDTSFSDSIIDFVITSPPYINVFNYHQNYRASSEYLNGSVLATAQSEIGSNRKNRGNRFFTVTQYCIDMALVFRELNRICKENSKIIFIVGRESTVKKTNFKNGEIVSEVACTCCNLQLFNRQERVFVNRYGENIYEDILYFKSSKLLSCPIENAKLIAFLILNKVLQEAPDESKSDLLLAIEKVDNIQPSIYFNKGNSR